MMLEVGWMRKFRFDKARLLKIDETTGCWLWQGALDIDGYAVKRLTVDGRPILRRAHIWYYEMWHGEVPPGMVVRHRCDVRRCVNPQHLQLGTVADNVRDTVTRGRMYRGGSTRKLTAEIAAQIRADLAAGASKVQLSRRHGVSRRTIREIELRQIWRDDEELLDDFSTSVVTSCGG